MDHDVHVLLQEFKEKGFARGAVEFSDGIKLTKIQLLVLILNCLDLTIKQIATEMGRSVKTVEYHVEEINKVLKTHSTCQRMHWALKHDLIYPGQRLK